MSTTSNPQFEEGRIITYDTAYYLKVAPMTVIPGYRAGRWQIDPVHSSVSLTVRHLTVPVRGHFSEFSGMVILAADFLRSSVEATIVAASFDSGYAYRDEKVRRLSSFLDCEQHPAITYRSAGLRADRRGYLLDGELCLRGKTRPLTLDLQLNGFGYHAEYGERVGFTASTSFNRRDFGIDFYDDSGHASFAHDGGFLLGNRIQVSLLIEAMLVGSQADGEA
jgi:polyisoprenoid-binding protein YceI